MRVPFFFFPYPHQRLLSVVSLIIAILIGMRWYFLVTSECISLMISIVENLFICLLAICMSLGENICVGLLPIFWLGFLLFRYCIVWDAYIFWILTPIGHIISKYFLPFNRLSFYLLLVSFALQKFLSLIRSHLFCFCFLYLGDISKIYYYNLWHSVLCFLLGVSWFQVLHLYTV